MKNFNIFSHETQETLKKLFRCIKKRMHNNYAKILFLAKAEIKSRAKINPGSSFMQKLINLRFTIIFESLLPTVNYPSAVSSKILDRKITENSLKKQRRKRILRRFNRFACNDKANDSARCNRN